MKIIFIDIDGVLNSSDTLPDELALGWEGWRDNLHTPYIHRLNEIVRRTSATVILSSTWRFHFTAAELTEMLREKGADFELADRTPPDVKGRVESIREWLRLNGQPDRWIVLDDDRECAECGEAWVCVEDGLTEADVEEAIRKLS